jgi:uncharacterized protein (DUF1697 family)
MARYLSLLRGINVAGHRKIKMTELVELYEKIGYTEVKTYLQSGNIIFTDRSKSGPQASHIEAAIKQALGYSVSVLIIPADRLIQIARRNPLLNKPEIAPQFLHLTFLFKESSILVDDAALPLAKEEAAVFENGHYYLYCPHGYGCTKINNSYFERILKIPATTRNWKTISALTALLAD